MTLDDLDDMERDLLALGPSEQYSPLLRRDALRLVRELRGAWSERDKLRKAAWAAEAYLESQDGPGDDEARGVLCKALGKADGR